MVTQHVDLIYLIIWSLAISNVLATAISMALARPIATLTAIRFTLIAPFIVVMIFLSAYQSKVDWGDLIAVMAVGVVGIYMKRFGWSRAALLIGLVLSQRLEASLYRTVQIYGFDIFLRPIALVILVLAAVSIWFAIRTKSRTSAEDRSITEASRRNIWPQVAFTGALLAFVAAVAIDASHLKFLAAVFPLTVAAIAGLLLLATIIRMLRRSRAPGLLFDADAELADEGKGAKSTLYCVGLMLGLPALTALFGFFLAAPLYVFLFLKRIAAASWWVSLLSAAGLVLFLVIMNEWLQARYAGGLLQMLVDLPAPIGS